MERSRLILLESFVGPHFFNEMNVQASFQPFDEGGGGFYFSGFGAYVTDGDETDGDNGDASRAWYSKVKEGVEFANDLFNGLKLIPTLEWLKEDFWRVNEDPFIPLEEMNLLYFFDPMTKTAACLKFTNAALVSVGNDLILSKKFSPGNIPWVLAGIEFGTRIVAYIQDWVRDRYLDRDLDVVIGGGVPVVQHQDRSKVDGLLSAVDLHFFDADGVSDWRGWQTNVKAAIIFANEVFDNLMLIPKIGCEETRNWYFCRFWMLDDGDYIKLPVVNALYDELDPLRKAVFVKFTNLALRKLGFYLTIGLVDNEVFASRRRPDDPQPRPTDPIPTETPRPTGPIPPIVSIPTERILNFYEDDEASIGDDVASLEDGRTT